MTDFTHALLSRIDQLESHLIELTRDLVRFPTINPPGEAYTPCAEYIGNWLQKRGFHVIYERGHDTPGDSDKFPRTNVIGRREGSRPGPTVHFNSHIDVVIDGAGWSVDPFEAVVKDGKIFGRGTCDMKGGMAASMIAVDAYLVQNPDFPGAIEISGTVDEESGGYGGVAYLAQKGYFSKPRVDHVIIPEPLNKDRICLGHRGVWWAEIETKGEIAHGSMPFLGDCAVRHMGAVLNAFENELFPALNKKQTTMPIVPEGAKRSTMNINSIHGGEPNTYDGLPSAKVPDSCTITIDSRYLIEETLGEVKGEVSQVLEKLKAQRPNFEYELRDLWDVSPTMTDKDMPVPVALADAIREVMKKEPDYVISPGTYDQKHVSRIGHLHDCVAYGPGILDLAHKPDEFVVIEDMMESAKVMAMATHTLLTGKVS